ncbi:B12-binding domain-containing radical SAM protein [Rhodospirillum sp. A1_3_36]|uniref:B12-binding domain-containing radical SAM protein n=1 Tax=Rhodospirillum sp. A1_3_36 TaxID=3391666 RepID=UPI0039A4DC3E
MDALKAEAASPKRLGILIIKPSRYDDDGYVIQWWRSFIIATGLTVVTGLVEDAARRRPLGPDVDIEFQMIDEFSQVIRPAKLAKWLGQFDRAAVFLTNVQTSQFPRALDIARQFTDLGFPSIIGGFHVSGTMAMVPDWEPAFAEVAASGATLYAGELECGIDTLLADIWADEVKPVYNFLKTAADLTLAPAQTIDPEITKRTVERPYGMEVSRGCPFLCSFCSIINVHGRTMRARDPAKIEQYLRDCVTATEGREVRVFITDDNFARNPIWPEVTAIMKRLAVELDITWNSVVQADLLSYRIKGFIEACRDAGVQRVFLGMESVRADNIAAAGKGQNKIHQMRDSVMAWKRAGIVTMAGYIIGFPNDTPERLAEDIRQLQDVIPIDYGEFFLLSPHPGSEDHKRMLAQGVPMDRDLTRYDTTHPVVDHPIMSREEWQRQYWKAWTQYYSAKHLKTVLARALYYGLPMLEVRSTFVCSRGAADFERVHALDAGAVRIKDRLSRRPGFPIEPMIPYAIKRVLRNTKILTVTGAVLIYAALLERWLRREQRLGRLEKHMGDIPLREEAPPPIETTQEALQTAAAAE